MSDHQANSISSDATPSKLQVCLFYTQQQLLDAVSKLLNVSSYELKSFSAIEDMVDFITNNCEQIDCLILSYQDRLDSFWNKLSEAEVLLPTVILSAESMSFGTDTKNQLATSWTKIEADNVYHQAEIRLYPTQIEEINSYINLAINKFISLAPGSKSDRESPEPQQPAGTKSLVSQQRRLTEKLKERLSYLGFFYKRNPDDFWPNLPQEQQEQLTDKISQGYRQILLLYFDGGSEINKLIDEFVDRAFFADIPTSQILEIHMDLMDDFAHQLKLEGRNDDILLDYRLPLIDIMAHLCEMYRRSIPGSDASMNLLFTIE